MDHIGSAHTPEDVEILKAVANQRMAEGQDELDFGDGQPRKRALTIRGSRAEHLWDALSAGFRAVGLQWAAAGDEVFKHLVLARIIEPTSKLDSIRVLDEIGIAAASYPTINRRLPVYAKDYWRRRIAAGFAEHVGLGPATLVLYDVTTLYSETDQGDGFRESGFSKERRLEPQITIGLLADVRGFPLMVHAFEGNKAETTTMIPVLHQFMAAHRIPEVTVVADAGMLSVGNLKALAAAGLRYIVGQPIPKVFYQLEQWQKTHPGQDPVDQMILTQPWARGSLEAQQSETIYYQYRADRARRSLRGSMNRSAKPPTPSPGRQQSNATGSSASKAARNQSTANWRPRPAPWPAGRPTSPTSSTRHRST